MHKLIRCDNTKTPVLHTQGQPGDQGASGPSGPGGARVCSQDIITASVFARVSVFSSNLNQAQGALFIKSDLTECVCAKTHSEVRL